MSYQVILAGGLAVFLFSLWWLLFQNKFFVEPNKRERLVLQNVLTGRIEVLKPGTHFRPPWLKELDRVDLNREDIAIKDEEAKTTDGAIMLVNYRYDIIAGRNYNSVTGQLWDAQNGRPNLDPDDEAMVLPEVVEWAVTRIDFRNHQQRVKNIVEGAVEAELGHYTLSQLVSPSMQPFNIPAFYIEGHLIHGCHEMLDVNNAADLYLALASRIEARANKNLTFVGINITSLVINNLRPKSDQTQDSIEKPLRTPRERQAADAIRNGREAEISYREALVAEDPAAFGEAVNAQAKRDAANSIADAIRHGTASISEGLRNFGRG